MQHIESEWVKAMRSGDFAAAWALSDHVLSSRNPATRDDPMLPYHMRWVWDGRPLAGRHILVRCYHGLGDTLQFARYLPALGTIAASLTLEVQPQLIPLLAGLPGVDRCVPFDVTAPAVAPDCAIEIMELAHALRQRPETLPPPYLRAMPVPVPLPPGAIGLCHRAGDWDAERSVPASLLAPLMQGAWVILQPGATSLPVVNPAGSPAAIVETAALIAGLELVVTVDTMVAHLAGALGRPTWLLLKHDADWRWPAGCRSPWYPRMRFYRQHRPGDWAEPLSRISSDLAAIRPALAAD